MSPTTGPRRCGLRQPVESSPTSSESGFRKAPQQTNDVLDNQPSGVVLAELHHRADTNPPFICPALDLRSGIGQRPEGSASDTGGVLACQARPQRLFFPDPTRFFGRSPRQAPPETNRRDRFPSNLGLRFGMLPLNGSSINRPHGIATEGEHRWTTPTGAVPECVIPPRARTTRAPRPHAATRPWPPGRRAVPAPRPSGPDAGKLRPRARFATGR